LKYSVSIFVEQIFKMQRLKVSCAERLIYMSLGVKGINPTGHVMHQQFNIQQLYVLPPTHYIHVFCIYLRTNSDLCGWYRGSLMAFGT
jgi:hypothetical protein